MVWNEIEWNRNFGMEDARMEWNGRQSSILPYQFCTRFCALYLRENTYRCRVVINNIVTEVFNFSINYQRILFVNKLRFFGCVHCTNSVRIALL